MQSDSLSRFSRQYRLIGPEGMRKLSEAKVIVFGIGGVGGYTAEALARAAVGNLKLVDSDTVEPTNINRQIIALTDTISVAKAEAMKERIAQINPCCRAEALRAVVGEDNVSEMLEGITYAVDAVDCVKAKAAIITECVKRGIPVVSSMGAGNRLCGTFRIMDIYETKDDGLARALRRELRKRGVEYAKVCCCDSKALVTPHNGEPVSSISYMPGLCGLTLAGEVIREIAAT